MININSKVLITGINGFVGLYLSAHLKNLGFEVFGTTRSPDIKNSNVINISLENDQQILMLLNNLRPNYIINLAGFSSVRDSWNDKSEVFSANVLNFVNLLEAVRKSEIAEQVKILSVGSSEEYGMIEAERMPIKENSPLNPMSPYGISKATVYMLVQHYSKIYNLNVVHARPFNHIGPGQKMGFVTSDFANQICQIESGIKEPFLKVGNLSAKRDFLDVRDIVEAYYLLMLEGKIGEVYNISSGITVEIKEVLDILCALSKRTIEIIQDKTLFRPIDLPVYYGDNNKIQSLGWRRSVDLEKSLEDILNYWREKA